MSDFAIPITESEEDASSGMQNKRINHLCPDLVFHQAPDHLLFARSLTQKDGTAIAANNVTEQLATYPGCVIIKDFNKYSTLLIVTNVSCLKIERQNIEIPDNAGPSTKKVISSAT